MNREQIDKIKSIAFEIRQAIAYPYVVYYIFAELDGNLVYLKEFENNQYYVDGWDATSMRTNTELYSPKPEPVKVPLTAEDLKQRIINRKPMWITGICSEQYCWQINFICNEFITTDDGRIIPYDDLMVKE